MKVDVTKTMSLTELDTRITFRGNSLVYKEFSRIAEEKGLSASLVLRKYMEKVVLNADLQKEFDW